MTDILYMAWRYLAYYKVKTVILVVSITLIVFLPVGLNVLVGQTARQLTTRATATPLLIGARGSTLELVLDSLYFESDTPGRMRFSESTRVVASELADAIPLYTRFRAQQHPIVGTTLDYFEFRRLEIADGRNMVMLGECILGAKAARALDLAPNDYVRSSPESVFDLAGVYPLKMKVAGVLAPANSPDDVAVFVDIKTAWVIEGLAHGHQDLSKPEAAAHVLKQEGRTVVGAASVVQYNEISADNVDSFHFHGDPEVFPITAVIAVPHNEKSGAILQGRYLGEDEDVQIVNPLVVMQKLLETILTVQNYVIAAVVIVGLSTLATASLVFLLSLRLRSREIETMHKIGGAKARVIAILSSEIIVVLVVGVVLAAVLTLLTSRFGAAVIRALIL
jgi:putative ABC transport system permease protein